MPATIAMKLTFMSRNAFGELYRLSQIVSQITGFALIKINYTGCSTLAARRRLHYP